MGTNPKYDENVFKIFPGDLIEITAEGTGYNGPDRPCRGAWRSSADVRFIGWVGPKGKKRAALHVERFNADDEWVGAECYEFSNRRQKRTSGPVHVICMNAPDPDKGGWLLIGMFWHGASNTRAALIERNTGRGYLQERTEPLEVSR